MRTTLGRVRRLIERSVDVGEIEFSMHRHDGARTNEPNTAIEQSIYQSLERWIGSSAWMPQDVAAAVQDLMDDPKHCEFFSYAAGTCHRGMSLRKDVLERWLGKEPGTLAMRGDEPCDVVLRPQRTTNQVKPLAFSKNTKKAWSFSMTPMPGNNDSGVSVLFTADAGNNEMLDLTNIQRRAWGLSKHGDEGEFISFEGVRCSHVVWMPSSEVWDMAYGSNAGKE